MAEAVGVTLPVVLTPGAAPGDADGPRATITGLAAALDLAPRAAADGGARDRGLRAHDCSGENREACAWWRWTTWPA